TWKRYVDPSGDNSDRLYHGRIFIPGATAGLVRISSVVGERLVVNKFPAHYDGSSLFLQLGYEDACTPGLLDPCFLQGDAYHDNGYYAHDDGTDDQCRYDHDGGPAYLYITIHHNIGIDLPVPSPEPRAPVDLWWDTVDDNFLPYNPDWWIHKSQGILPNS